MRVEESLMEGLFNKQLDLLDSQLKNITAAKQLDGLWLDYFGSKGKLKLIAREIVKAPVNKKPVLGSLFNEFKKNIEKRFADKKREILGKLPDEWFDVTVPGIWPQIGRLHPQTRVLNELLDIFCYLGYSPAVGPEIENQWYNFTSLNFPPDHPALDTQQSLRLEEKDSQGSHKILRTQTSSMQVRVMEKSAPPFRVIVPGKCFRYEAVDASHGFEFWQLEGFAVDKDIRLSDLFGTISYVLKKLMGEDSQIRFACTNFPFVEPGVDTYIKCTVCQGQGCSFCKQSGWSEIMPAGMIHPHVLKYAGIDSRKWQGFAFAIGLSRAVTLKYAIDDLRVLTSPDLRILNQF